MQIPETMLAAQVVEFNQPYKIHKVPTPRKLRPHDILVKTAAASLCHSDFLVLAGLYSTRLPCTASHEAAGTVVALGSDVTRFQVGDRVLADVARHYCGDCSDCAAEETQHYCQRDSGAIGMTHDGAFAEYVLVNSKGSVRLPDALPFVEAAPFACAGRTIWGAMAQTKLEKGQWLALVGSGGGLGHLGIQFAKALGLQVIAIDARQPALELSKACGADVVLDARTGTSSVAKEIRKFTGGLGADATINLVEAANGASLACAITKRHGTMIQVSQPKDFKISFRELIMRDVRIQGAMLSPLKETQKMIDAVGEYGIKCQLEVFKGFEEIPELIKKAHSGKINGKGVVIIDEDQMKPEKMSIKSAL